MNKTVIKPTVNMSWRRDILPYDSSNEIPSLPGKLWKLLALATFDMQRISKKPDYEFYMNTWHSGVSDRLDDNDHTFNKFNNPKKCYVCMAGAVLANTLKFPFNKKWKNENIKGDWYKRINSDQLALDAINAMRNHNFNYAYELLYDVYEAPSNIYKELDKLEYNTFYNDEKVAFSSDCPQKSIKSLWNIVKKLKDLNV